MKNKDLELLSLLNLSFLIVFILFMLLVLSFEISTDSSQNGTSASFPSFDDSEGFYDKNYTYSEVLDLGDVSLCPHIADKNLVETCQIKLCECSDDQCFFDKARLDMNESLCYNISDDSLRASCSSSITRSEIMESAVLKDDISLCSELEGSSFERCRDNYYFAKRFNEDNIKYCESIKNEKLKSECEK